MKEKGNRPGRFCGLSGKFLFSFLILFLLSSSFVRDLWAQGQQDPRQRLIRRDPDQRRLGGSARSHAEEYEREMQDSLSKIPWDVLSTDSKIKVRSIVRQPSLFRRMPTQAVYCDPEMYQFLLEHPDLVVGIWERLGVTQISLRELNENRYLMRETSGTVARVEVLHRTRDLCIVYAKGLYRGPFLARAIEGETVLLLRTRFARDSENEPYVVCKLDAFIRIDSLGADFLAKLFSTSLGKIADSNFEQTVAFVGHVSDAASVNSGSVRRIGEQIKGVRSEIRDDFVDVIDRVVMRTARRQGRTFPQYWADNHNQSAPTNSSLSKDLEQKKGKADLFTSWESSDRKDITDEYDAFSEEILKELELSLWKPEERLLDHDTKAVPDLLDTDDSSAIRPEGSVWQTGSRTKQHSGNISLSSSMPSDRSSSDLPVGSDIGSSGDVLRQEGIQPKTHRMETKSGAVFGTPKIAKPAGS